MTEYDREACFDHDDRAQAELGAEREHNAEQALLFVQRLIDEQIPWAEVARTKERHLRTLCYECGIPYERIIARSMAR